MKRKIEIFVSDCPLCTDAVEKVKSEACDNCEIEVLNIKSDNSALEKSKEYNISSVPSVVIDGKLASCCEKGGINLETLKQLGLGQKN